METLCIVRDKRRRRVKTVCLPCWAEGLESQPIIVTTSGHLLCAGNLTYDFSNFSKLEKWIISYPDKEPRSRERVLSKAKFNNFFSQALLKHLLYNRQRCEALTKINSFKPRNKPMKQLLLFYLSFSIRVTWVTQGHLTALSLTVHRQCRQGTHTAGCTPGAVFLHIPPVVVKLGGGRGTKGVEQDRPMTQVQWEVRQKIVSIIVISCVWGLNEDSICWGQKEKNVRNIMKEE